jgi:hypothetical protein
MGCSASITPASTISSVVKVDVATNTVSEEFVPNSLPTINSTRCFNDISTQTDCIQTVLQTKQLVSPDNFRKAHVNDTSNRLSSEQDDHQQRTDASKIVVSTHNQVNPRFNQTLADGEELDWILNGMDANQFCAHNQTLVMSANQVTPAIVVDAMEKADDLRNVAAEVWELLHKGKTTGDATYLIQAYTVESTFYKILNRRLARQTLGNPMGMDIMAQMQTLLSATFGQFEQCISALQEYQTSGQVTIPSNEVDWAKLFLQAIYRLIMIPNSTLRYQGLTYRGMRLTQKELEYYEEDKVFVCNKAITSTSKQRSVAQSFIDSEPRPEHMIDVMFTYNIESFIALFAIDVHTISSIPSEEEVLIMPGVLFTIGKTKIISPYSREIELRSAFKDLAEGMMANSFAALLPDFESESSAGSESESEMD